MKRDVKKEKRKKKRERRDKERCICQIIAGDYLSSAGYKEALTLESS